jgi:hypothetical protein
MVTKRYYKHFHILQPLADKNSAAYVVPQKVDHRLGILFRQLVQVFLQLPRESRQPDGNSAKLQKDSANLALFSANVI